RVSAVTTLPLLASASLAMAKGDGFLPLLAAEILARVSGLQFLDAAAILARVSGLGFFPFFAPEIFARVSGVPERSLAMADILALDAAECLLPRLEADILALASAEIRRPRAGAAASRAMLYPMVLR